MKFYNGNSVEEVVGLLDKYKGECKVIAGGTDIIIALRNEKISPKVLIDIGKIKELKTIEENKDKIFIGAGVSYTRIIESNLFNANLYALKKACREVGSPQIRNRGTIGGNIANNSPAADSVPPLIALGSILKIVSIRGTREVLLEDYCSNNKELGLKDDELILGIEFNKLRDNQSLGFSKLGLRKALAISRISISTLIGFDENGIIDLIKVVSGSIGRYPMREVQVEEFLIGKELEPKVINEAVEVLQSSMDVRLKGRATLPYKRRAVEGVLKDGLITAVCYLEPSRENVACHLEPSREISDLSEVLS